MAPAKRAAPLRALAVGSSDSGGGAGIQADLKAFTALGAYGTTVVVGVTAQNTVTVTDRAGVPPDVVAAQLDAVLGDIGADAVKVGTTWSPAVCEVLADRLSRLRGVPIVVDPVLGTAAGSALGAHTEAELTVVRRTLLPLATVLTPNVAEARRLAGVDVDDPELLTRLLAEQGAAAVLLTDALPGGGDWLFDGSRHLPLPGARARTGCEHGAGCSHSAALTVLLGRGVPLPEASRTAHRLASEAVARGWAGIGQGVHPVDMDGAVRGAVREGVVA